MQDESLGRQASTKNIKVVLDDGTTFYIQAKTVASESNVGLKHAAFDKVIPAIEALGQQLSGVWKTVKPDYASVEFGVEFIYDSGQVLALFVDGSANVSMKITLSWGQQEEITIN